MTKRIGIITAGSDAPGVNAAIRGFGRAITNTYNFDLVGFKDGFLGLVENRAFDLSDSALSGILTLGGTILGTSIQLPAAMPKGDQILDLTNQAVETYRKQKLDRLSASATAPPRGRLPAP